MHDLVWSETNTRRKKIKGIRNIYDMDVERTLCVQKQDMADDVVTTIK